MPIGKNAIKRVSNNGYSKVASSAPDMENSTVSVAEQTEKEYDWLQHLANDGMLSAHALRLLT